MQNLIHAPEITETLATEAIMKACRANEKREIRAFAVGDNWVKVSFTLLADGTYEACMRNKGVVVALAIVDGLDV